MSIKSFQEFFNEDVSFFETLKYLDTHVFAKYTGYSNIIKEAKKKAEDYESSYNEEEFDEEEFENSDSKLFDNPNKASDADEDNAENEELSDELDAGTINDNDKEEEEKFLKPFNLGKVESAPHSDAEDLERIRIYQENPNSPEGQKAINDLIMSFVKYTYTIVASFIRKNGWRTFSNSDREELKAVALNAIWQAAMRFDSSKYSKFRPFLSNTIENELKNSINPYRKKRIETGGREGSGWSTISIDDTVGGESGEWVDKEESVKDKIEDPNASDNFYNPEDEVSEKENLLRAWIEDLPTVEKKAILIYCYPDVYKARYNPTFEYEKKDMPQLIDICKELNFASLSGARACLRRVVEDLKKKAVEAGLVDRNYSDEEMYRLLIGKSLRKSYSSSSKDEADAE